jgi:hypothetical protein
MRAAQDFRSRFSLAIAKELTQPIWAAAPIEPVLAVRRSAFWVPGASLA